MNVKLTFCFYGLLVLILILFLYQYSFPILLLILVLGFHLSLYLVLVRPMRIVMAAIQHNGSIINGFSKMRLGKQSDLFRICEAMESLAANTNRYKQQATEQKLWTDILFSSVAEGVLLVDSQSQVVRVNETIRDWLGISTNCIGTDVCALVEDPLFRETFQLVTKRAAVLPTEASIAADSVTIDKMSLGPNKARIVRCKISTIRLVNTDPVYMVFLFDLSELYKNASLRRDFFANVSHELKTPITAIIGYSELLTSLGLSAHFPQADVFLEIIQRNAHGLSNQILQMLQLAQLESGVLPTNMSVYSVPNGIQRAFENLGPKAISANVTLVFENNALDNETLIAVADQMDSVFLNLIENSIKYNRSEGAVVVTLDSTPDSISIKFKDTGIGFAEQDKQRAFERFFRADKSHSRKTPGSGLGLAIVKHIVQSADGQITLESAQGQGSLVTLVFPKKR